MVHVVPRPHHHLKGWDQLAAGGTVPGSAKKPAEGRVQRAQEPARELGVRGGGQGICLHPWPHLSPIPVGLECGPGQEDSSTESSI